MSSLIERYTELPSFIKFGVGGAVAAFGLGLSSSNPALLAGYGLSKPVTAIAVAAIGQAVAWLPNMVKRCFSRNAPLPAAVPALLPRAVPALLPRAIPVPLPAAIPLEGGLHGDLQRAIEASLTDHPTRRRNDAALQEAIEYSLRDMRNRSEEKTHPDFELERAIKLSLDEMDDAIDPSVDALEIALRQSLRGRTPECPICDFLGCDPKIPMGLLIETEGDEQGFYNVAAFLQTMLTLQSPAKDPLGKTVSDDMLEQATEKAAIDCETFKYIWLQANWDIPNGIDVAGDALAIDRRRDLRSRLFIEMLQSKEGTGIELKSKRQRFVDYYKKEHPDWWHSHGGR